jgi:hypothetical protein
MPERRVWLRWSHLSFRNTNPRQSTGLFYTTVYKNITPFSVVMKKDFKKPSTSIFKDRTRLDVKVICR